MAWSPGAAVSSQIWRAPLLYLRTYRSNVKPLYHICLKQHLPVEHQLALSNVSGAHVQGPKLTLSCMLAVHAQCQGPQPALLWQLKGHGQQVGHLPMRAVPNECDVENDRGNIQEPQQCPSCGKKFTMRLMHNWSTFQDKQIVKMQVQSCACGVMYIASLHQSMKHPESAWQEHSSYNAFSHGVTSVCGIL